MARPKKDQKILNIRLDAAVSDQLTKYAAENGQTKTLTIETILRKAFDEYFAESRTSEEQV